MSNITHSPNFRIRPMSPEEWQYHADGKLSLPPGFWEGPDGKGIDLHAMRVTALGAFVGDKIVGYAALREVTKASLTEETSLALRGLLRSRRVAGDISQASRAALEKPETPEDQVVALNLSHVLVGEKSEGVGTALTDVVLDRAGAYAGPEEPITVHLSVAQENPARRLWVRSGFQDLVRADGTPFVRNHDYYLPPDAHGNFVEPINVPHAMMGTVVEGPSGTDN